MKNPLNKRIFSEIKCDKGRYIAIFLFLILAIGFISGFIIADSSMIEEVNKSDEKYNIENGNFEIYGEVPSEIQKIADDEQISLYENFYIEESVLKKNQTESTSRLRIFKNREEVNTVCVMKGNLPEGKDEIAIDRMYADNNELKVGDLITVGNYEYKITGLVALPDYLALFSDNTDSMFDSIKFGVAIVTPEGFGRNNDAVIHYDYSWKYSKEPEDEKQEKEWADNFSLKLSKTTTLAKYIPKYSNQAIMFTRDDMGGDKVLIEFLLYIVIAIIAFIFAVTISNTIASEAAVIGTLRASGYKRSEIVIHYMAGPLIVTGVAAVIGNVLGYTVFKKIMADMYYGSYSLPTYHTLWSPEAFIKTTVVPLIMMLIINFVILSYKLRLKPLRFIRNDLSSRKRKKAVKLPHYKFLTRFKIRVIFQNMSGYVMMFVGIIFANVLLMFGMMMTPLLNKYEDDVINNKLAEYQYVLKAMQPTETEGAEKYLVTSLITDNDSEEEITVYGISENSNYAKINIKDGALISEGYHEKYGIDKGDTITLVEKYTGTKHSFKVKGYYNYPAALSVFVPEKEFCAEFNIPDGAFNGYFSNKVITDIDEKYIATKITEEDLTKMSRQLERSMGSMFYMFYGFAIILFMIMIYILAKVVIEKNSNSISMVKILGYNNNEIRKLYMTSTTIMVAICLALSLPVSYLIIRKLYYFFMGDMKGWLTFYIKPDIYWQMFLIGMASYFVVELILSRKIRKIPMSDALKNVE